MSRLLIAPFLFLLLLATAARGQEPESVALAGEPFGIARVRIAAPALATLEPDLVVTVRDAERRALYSASRRLQVAARPGGRLRRAEQLSIGGGRLLARLGQLIESAGSPPGRETIGYEVYFCFPATRRSTWSCAVRHQSA